MAVVQAPSKALVIGPNLYFELVHVEMPEMNLAMRQKKVH